MCRDQKAGDGSEYSRRCRHLRHCPKRKGLALSSRNSYLTDSEQERALLLHESLGKARERIASGEHNAETIKTLIANILSRDPDFSVDYISVADPDSSD